jgi:Glyoxalase-like domain
MGARIRERGRRKVTGAAAGPGIWVGSIVIDCDDFQKMMTFWQEALHYVPKYPPDGGWVILKDPRGVGPNISLNLTSEGHLDQYRLHLDLYSTDAKKEVERLIKLGATLKRAPAAKEDFTTLADPDGNLFDVISAKELRFGER